MNEIRCVISKNVTKTNSLVYITIKKKIKNLYFNVKKKIVKCYFYYSIVCIYSFIIFIHIAQFIRTMYVIVFRNAVKDRTY